MTAMSSFKTNSVAFDLTNSVLNQGCAGLLLGGI